MKARITTVLSLTGVLVAGSAAALVNTQVLQGSAVPAGSGNKVTIALDKFASAVDQDAPTVVGDTTLPPAPTPESPDPALAAAAVTTQAIYQIDDAGLVTVDTAGDVLTLVSAVPNPDWSVVNAQSVDAYNVEVQFQMGTTLVEFRANLLFGVVGTAVVTTSLDTGTGGVDDTVASDAVVPTANTTAPVTQDTPTDDSTPGHHHRDHHTGDAPTGTGDAPIGDDHGGDDD
jgi:hypothetical protein